MTKILLILGLSVIILLGIFIFDFFESQDKLFRIVFCDVGQGDAIYIRTPQGADILIDGGPNEAVLDCLEDNMSLSDREIDAVIMTHAHIDHYGGLIDVLERYKVDYFVTSGSMSDNASFKYLEQIVRDKGITKKDLVVGEKIRLDKVVEMKTLWPTKVFAQQGLEDGNNTSLVQMLSYGNFEVLLTGDINFEILNLLLADAVDIDVMKLSHHGSKTGTNKNTFDDIVPKLAIISAGINNRYGHPNKEVLSALEKSRVNYKTTVNGSVEIISDGKAFWLESPN